MCCTAAFVTPLPFVSRHPHQQDAALTPGHFSYFGSNPVSHLKAAGTTAAAATATIAAVDTTIAVAGMMTAGGRARRAGTDTERPTRPSLPCRLPRAREHGGGRLRAPRHHTRAPGTRASTQAPHHHPLAAPLSKNIEPPFRNHSILGTKAPPSLIPTFSPKYTPRLPNQNGILAQALADATPHDNRRGAPRYTLQNAYVSIKRSGSRSATVAIASQRGEL